MLAHTVGHYSIEGLLGAGGMGSVYLGYDSRLHRNVAIKILRAGAFDEADRRRFRREAETASALNHANIVTIYDIGSEAGMDFIVMEHVPGSPLNRVTSPGGLPIEQAIDYAVQITSAIAAAHSAGILHRDIKPGNILLTPSGKVKIVDFGLAKLVEGSAEDASTSIRITAGAHFAGTPGYAAPEQVECRPLDSRADVFAIGAVIYEMLTGNRAFHGDSSAAAFAAVLHQQPPSLKTFRRDVPLDLERIVLRCLQKKAESRYASAGELLSDLRHCQARLATRRIPVSQILRRPTVAAAIIALVMLSAGVGTWVWIRESRARWVRDTLPEAARLIRQGKNFAAFRLLRKVKAFAPGDPRLQELLAESTVTASIQTTPVGAEVYVRDFFDEPDSWEFLGRAPLRNLRLPWVSAVWKIAAPGFRTKVVMAHTVRRNLLFTLVPAAVAPDQMVDVPAGSHELFSSGAVMLDGFWIDRCEVTNRQFRDFVTKGGYERQEYWTAPFFKDGSEISWEEARRIFRDRTGRRGPASWQLGTYPDGQDDYPVGGVSWYEAAAYCASVGKELPTIHHWYAAAFLGGTTEVAQFGNFLSAGPERVGGPRRLGFFGTYDMAGNVREWCWNEADGQRRFLLGGGFTEPSYGFRDQAAAPPLDRSAVNGFRCMRSMGPVRANLKDPVPVPFRDYRRERPAGDELFAAYQSLYKYDRTPSRGSVASVDDTAPDWRVERVSFDSANGTERVAAFLFLPKRTPPPYQTVIWFPGANAFYSRSGFEPSDTSWFLFLVRSGRAVLYPMYKGTYERFVRIPDAPSAWRDCLIDASRDLGRAIDYIETRPDLDGRRLAYYGLSMGAAVGPIMTAVEPRFRAAVLLGGGLYFWRRPPESEAFNFAPRVKIPTLMLNGRHDYYFPVETSQVPLFESLGTPTNQKRHRLFDSGHVPSEKEELMGEILDWLDRYLGPVTKVREVKSDLPRASDNG